MTEAFINVFAGAIIGATPFAILWGFASRRAEDWKDLAYRMDKECERAQRSSQELLHAFDRMKGLYMELRFRHLEEEADQRDDWWKHTS